MFLIIALTKFCYCEIYQIDLIPRSNSHEIIFTLLISREKLLSFFGNLSYSLAWFNYMENIYFDQNDESKMKLFFSKGDFYQDSACVFHNQKKRKDGLETRVAFSWILILTWNFFPLVMTMVFFLKWIKY